MVETGGCLMGNDDVVVLLIAAFFLGENMTSLSANDPKMLVLLYPFHMIEVRADR